MKKSFINLLFLFLIICILFGILKYPKVSLNSAYEGLYTWFNIIIPSLLPFFIVSEILIKIGFVDFIGKLLEPLMKPIFNVPGLGAFPFSMSIISGYPMGAKIVSNLRQNKSITKTEAERILSFSSTSGPLFMLGAVSIGMLNSPSLAPLIIYPHYLGAITLGLIFKFYKKSKGNLSTQNKLSKNIISASIIKKHKFSIGTILASSVKNSMNTIALIGGFVIFYSVITELLFVSKTFNYTINLINNIMPIKINIDIIKGFIAGILELTTGCKRISATNISFIYKIAIINFLIGWSGISIHSQAISFISATDINSVLYLFSKFLHGVFSCIYSLVLYKLKYKNIIAPSFLPSLYPPESIYFLDWPELFVNSIKLVILMTIYLLLCSLIMLIIYCLSDSE